MKKFSLSLISFLAVGRAFAGELPPPSSNLAEYAVPNFSNVDCEKQYKGVSNLNWGLCELEKISQERAGDKKVLDDRLENVTRILAQAQQEGLSIRQQNLAAMFEGFAHCERAKLIWEGRKMLPAPSGSGEIVDSFTTTGFCAERSKAAGSFSDVRFNELLVNKTYRDAGSGSDKINSQYAEELIERMTSCQVEVVAEYGRCGQLNPQSMTDVATTAKEAAKTELVAYFGCSAAESKAEADATAAGAAPGPCKTLSARAPASAMFARKIDRLTLVTGPSVAKLGALKIRRDQLDAELKLFTDQFNSVASPAASEAFDTFQSATLITANIFKEYELWRQGLLGGTTIQDLAKRKDQLEPYNAKLEQLNAELAINVANLSSMLTPPEEKAKQLADLCRLRYCGLYSENMELPLGASCAKTSFKNNSACWDKVTVDGTVKSVDEICSVLPAQYRKKGLSPSDARSCMETLVNTNKSAAPNPRSMFDSQPAL